MIAVATDGTAQDISERFVPARAVADEIVKRLANNELSRSAGDYIRKIAEFGQSYWSTMIFGGYDPLRFDAVANPDGSLRLELLDPNGCTLWRTTLTPAA
jgi:hypothetical protein